MYVKDRYLEHFWWVFPQANDTRPHWCLVNIGSGYGLGLSDLSWHHHEALNEPVPKNLKYKMQQILKLKWFSSGLAVVFAQSLEARC